MDRRSFIKSSIAAGIAGVAATDVYSRNWPMPSDGTKQALDKRLYFKEDGTFKILQFTDTHYIAGDPRSKRALENVNQMLDLEKPDLVIHTGDVIFGEPAEASAREILQPIVDRKIPFAVAFGNHDEEFGKSRREMLDIVMSMPYNLNTRTDGIYGASNSVIALDSPKDKKTRRLLYILDSNRGATIPDIPDTYGHIHFDQIAWYRKKSAEYTQKNGGKPVPAFAFFHIPLPEHEEATFDARNGKVAGTRKEMICCPRINSGMFVSMKEMGDVQGMFVGHDHNNDYAAYWNKLFFVYGRFSGCDTVYNDLKPNGARVMEVYEERTSFRSWIRLNGGAVTQDLHFPDDFVV